MGEDEDAQPPEDKVETERHIVKVEDARQKKDAGQQFALSERLKQDSVDTALYQAKGFLGSYSQTEVDALSINIVDGDTGEGTIKGDVIEVQLPGREQAIKKMRTALEPVLASVPDDRKNACCEKIVYAVTASTVLHEGIHGLLNSGPESQFARDFERVSQLPNEQLRLSTLLDEGVTYALQDTFAPSVEPLGGLTPAPKETDRPEVKQRKELGQRLKSEVKRYIDEGRGMDDAFLTFATSQLKEVIG